MDRVLINRHSQEMSKEHTRVITMTFQVTTLTQWNQTWTNACCPNIFLRHCISLIFYASLSGYVKTYIRFYWSNLVKWQVNCENINVVIARNGDWKGKSKVSRDPSVQDQERPCTVEKVLKGKRNVFLSEEYSSLCDYCIFFT